MKRKTLSVLAGVGTLIVSGTAPGAFQGLTWSSVPNPYGIFACDIYAEFDNPDDHIVAVAGTAAAPLSLDVVVGHFYQHPPHGEETAPIPALIGLFPSLAYDTFVTIGVRVDDGTDATMLTPGWPEVGEDGLADATNLAWFVAPDAAQGAPDQNGRVLIGQFSTDDGIAPRGRFVILAISDGEPALIHRGFCCFLSPAPCTEGDVNGDNVVGIGDFLSMLGQWGPCPPDDFCWADLNGDWVVNVVDFLLLLGNWTPPPEPLPSVDADVSGDGVVDNIDLLTLLGCWGPVVAGCEPPDLDGDGIVGTRDLLVMLVAWG